MGSFETTDDPQNEPWVHQTAALRALDLEFAVRTNDGVLGRYVERTFRAFAAAALDGSAAVADRPPRLYSLVVRPGREGGEVWLDGEMLYETPEPTEVLSHLLWHINREVVAASSDRHLLVHASAAEHDGRVVLFPAATESGKTTLVAGLVRSGLRYVTDEAVAVELATGLVHPFPKALSIDPGSWGILAGLRPVLEPGEERFVRGQWHVDPVVAFGPGATSVSPWPPRFVIGPSYQPDGRTALAPIHRSEAVLLLARNSFNFRRHGRAGLAAAAAVAGQSACYRLTVGDLDTACRLVHALLAGDRR